MLQDFEANPDVISIVFSVWTRTLDIASALCHHNNIPHVRVDGRVPQHERTLALQNFSKHISEEGSASVLLMTLGTGAQGYVKCNSMIDAALSR